MKILSIGDSHCKYLNITDELYDLNPFYKGVQSKVIRLDGATIAGFGKRNSTLQSLDKLKLAFGEFIPDYLLFALGQVDIELGYYYKIAIKRECISFDEFILNLVDTYKKTIIEFISQHGVLHDRVIIKGINIPVLINSRSKAIQYTFRIVTENISNEDERKSYRNEIQKILPSSIERTRRHQYFNEALKTMSQENDFRYFDLNDYLGDNTQFGLLKKEYIPAGFDHHLIDSLTIRELHINEMLKSILG